MLRTDYLYLTSFPRPVSGLLEQNGSDSWIFRLDIFLQEITCDWNCLFQVHRLLFYKFTTIVCTTWFVQLQMLGHTSKLPLVQQTPRKQKFVNIVTFVTQMQTSPRCQNILYLHVDRAQRTLGNILLVWVHHSSVNFCDCGILLNFTLDNNWVTLISFQFLTKCEFL